MAERMNRRAFVGAAAATAAGLVGMSGAAEAAAPGVKIIGIACSLRKGRSTAKAV